MGAWREGRSPGGPRARRRPDRVPGAEGRPETDRPPAHRQPVRGRDGEQRSRERARGHPRGFLQPGERKPHLLPRPPPVGRNEGAGLRSGHLLPRRRRRTRGRGRGGRRGDTGRRGSARGGRGHGRAARRRHRGRRRFGGRSRRVTGAFARRALGPLLGLAFLSACIDSTPPPKSTASNDVEGAPKLARDAGAVLLQASAYDYGLAAPLASAQTRTVAASRYGPAIRNPAKTTSAFNATVLAGTLDRSGPIREKIVPLADGLTDLARDGETYADGADPAAFARVISDVTAGWQRLRDLSTVLPKDDVLQGTIARG